MLDKKLNKLKKFVPKNSKLGKAMAIKDKLTRKEDKKEEENKGSGKKGSSGTPSTMSIAKIIFGSGIAVGGLVITGCLVMSIVTMFSTVTGTSVQIIDGSIIQYGEPTPGPEKDKKKGGTVGEYDGDEYYMKSKMIVQAVQNDKSLKKKVDKVKVPDGVPKAVRSRIGMNTKRGGIYHIIEIAYIFRELCNNEFYSKFKINGGSVVSIPDRLLWAEFLQENCCGASYEAHWNELSSDSWLEAHYVTDTEGSFEGAFQVSDGYFNDRAYITFIPSLEKDNGDKYGFVGYCSKKEYKDKMTYNSDLRTSVVKSYQYTGNGGSKYYHFTDMAASANNLSFQTSMDQKYKSFKDVFSDEASYQASSTSLMVILGDINHRGAGFYNFSNNGNTIVPQGSSCSTHMVIMGEFLKEGLYSEENLDKLNINCDFSEWTDWKPWVQKIINQCSKDNIAGVSKSSMLDYFMTNYYSGNPDGGLSPFYKPLAGYQATKEVKSLIDIAFDELGLTLPTSGGGKMELKEKKGEFQGFWSDKNGKTLSSDEMKAYSSAGDFSNQKKSAVVGLKETISLGGTFDNDTFKGKFGDDVGVIWYKQATANENWGGFRDNPHAVDGLGSYFCGGYAVSIVLSTMLHRYINPAEIIYATNTYDERHGGSSESGFWSGDSGGMFLVETQKKCYEEQMYKGKKLFKVEGPTSLSKEKVNSTLDNGGLVTGSFKHPIAAGSGHFVTIRSKDNNGNYYLADPACNSTRRNDPENKLNHKFSWSSLSNLSKSQVLYINPGPGYQDYLNDYMTSQSEASGGSSGGSGRYLGEEIVEYAKTFVGKLPYNHGLSLTSGTDCSGFVKLIYGHFNIETDMPRASYDQYDHWIKKGTKKVPFELNKLKPGDLLYYKNGSNIGHVAMYAGNGKVVHESSKKTGCKTSDWNYRRPAGVFRIIDDNAVSSSGGNANLGGGWSGNTMSNKNFPYWKQTGTPIGSGKNQCPHSIKSSCGVYSEIKILKAFGINKSFDALYNAGNGIIRVRGTVLVLPQGVPTLAAKYGVSLNYDQDNSKYDLTKPLIMKKVAGDIQKILKKGGYCMMEIDYDGTRGNSGGAGGGDHFVVVSASNGEQLKIWDSGHVSNTNASHSTWFNYYKNSATANRLYVTRLSYYWPK